MIDDALYQKYMKALLAGNRSECVDIVQTLLDGKIGLQTLYRDLFHRSMYQVGELWETNRISVAREHLATATTESLLNLAYPHIFSSERKGKKALISCSVNEYHQIGGKMVADIFEMYGWDSRFLGANSSTESILKLIDEEKPDIVGLSLSILSNIDHLVRGIESVRADFPRTDLLVGGQAFRWGGVEMINKYPETEYVPSLDSLEKLLGQ